MVGPIDYDFKIFSRYYKTPWLWASAETDMITVESDYQDLMNLFIENYDELRDIRYLKERLTIYEIIEILNNYKNTKNEEMLQEAKEKVKILIK